MGALLVEGGGVSWQEEIGGGERTLLSLPWCWYKWFKGHWDPKWQKKNLPLMRGDEGAEIVKSHQFHTEHVVLYWRSHTQTSHCRCAGKKNLKACFSVWGFDVRTLLRRKDENDSGLVMQTNPTHTAEDGLLLSVIPPTTETFPLCCWETVSKRRRSERDGERETRAWNNSFGR